MAALRSKYRHGGRRWLLGITLTGAAVALILALTAGAAKPPPPPTPVPEVTGTVGHAAGFEDNDGDLSPLAGGDQNSNDTNEIKKDWNSFSLTWTGQAPFQTGGDANGNPKITGGFQVLGLTDAQATNSDTGFAGGVKQDNECASVIGSKAPNKDDLRDFYIASKTAANNHTYLELAWVRIPQNTTSPSAHIAFEFNQATKDTSPCGAGSDGLVHRQAGDLLVKYDFAGGSGSPAITTQVWRTSGSCDVSNDTAPCWGPTNTLDPCEAEANVDTGLSHPGVPNDTTTHCGSNELSNFSYLLPGSTNINDSLAPSSQALGASEFGEAGIDLTTSNIFPAGTCESFGTVYAVSRSSGDSSTAAMEDLVGPGHFQLSNCGEIKIIKQTAPRGTTTTHPNFDFTSNIPAPVGTSNSPTCTTGATADATPGSFTLADDGTDTSTSTNVEDCINVQPGSSYNVTEGNVAGWSLKSLTCDPPDNTTTSYGTQDGTNAKKANITLAAGGVVTCTFVNQPNLGAITVTKTGKDKNCTGTATDNPGTNVGTCTTTAGVADLKGAGFEIWKENNACAGLQTTVASIPASCTGVTTIDSKVKSESLTASDGTACFDGLAWSGSGTDYYVNESTHPAGYSIDDTDGNAGNGVQTYKTKTVTTSATCPSGSTAGTGTSATITFNDTPLSTIEVKFSSQVATGATRSQIVCSPTGGTAIAAVTEDGNADNSGPSGAAVYDDSDESFANLPPGSYTCTVLVDP
jgi:hypothetical protein